MQMVSHTMPSSSHFIPPSFISKKAAILASLSVHSSTYTDLSPKGSVDVAIKSLIDRINALEGVVTTSSCSGRISVFLEGSKNVTSTSEETELEDGQDPKLQQYQERNPVPGGKGLGGRWLYVSHESQHGKIEFGSITRTLGMGQQISFHDARPNLDRSETRFARFQFEPMVWQSLDDGWHRAGAKTGIDTAHHVRVSASRPTNARCSH